MTVKNHLQLAAVAVGGWAFFYLIGIPSDYFQKWSINEHILLTFITFFAILPVIAAVTMILINQDYVKTGIWLSAYGSVLLALLDFLVCGVIRKEGLHCFISHWYITIAYFYIWLIVPLVGITQVKFKVQLHAKEP